jgi:hypothetical protein
MAKQKSTIFEQNQKAANKELKEFWAANSAVIDSFAITEWSAKNRIQYTTVRTWLQPEGVPSSRNGGIMEVQDLLTFLKTKVPTETAGILNQPVIAETFNLNA